MYADSSRPAAGAKTRNIQIFLLIRALSDGRFNDLNCELFPRTARLGSARSSEGPDPKVTVDGKTRGLGEPFFVIATQNPLEQFGTFSLPKSQLDRFLMRIDLGYPDRAAEKSLLQMGETRGALEELQPILSSEDVLMIQGQVRAVHVSDALFDYLQDLLDFTRQSAEFHVGLSPRAGLSLLAATRSRAYLAGRDFALPEDLQQVLPWVVGHRLSAQGGSRCFTPDQLLSILSGLVRTPGQGPLDFAAVVGTARQDLKGRVATIVALYIRLRYDRRGGSEDLKRFKLAVRQFKP